MCGEKGPVENAKTEGDGEQNEKRSFFGGHTPPFESIEDTSRKLILSKHLASCQTFLARFMHDPSVAAHGFL
jgi:hypothetical protein